MSHIKTKLLRFIDVQKLAVCNLLKTSASKQNVTLKHFCQCSISICLSTPSLSSTETLPGHQHLLIPFPQPALYRMVCYTSKCSSMYTWCSTRLKGGAVWNTTCHLLITDTSLSAFKYIVLFVLTVIHQWVFQLWARKSNGPKVIQHKSRATSINNISQAEIRHTIQKWKHVRPWLFHS